MPPLALTSLSSSAQAGGHGEAAVLPAIGAVLLATLIDGKAICNTE